MLNSLLNMVFKTIRRKDNSSYRYRCIPVVFSPPKTKNYLFFSDLNNFPQQKARTMPKVELP